MILRLYLFILYLTALISAGLAAEIVININPYQSPFWVIAIFYAALFLFFTSIFGLVFFYLKVWASNREVIFAHLLPTLRQSVFISLGIVGILFLQQIRVLNWWVAALFILSVFLIELFFRGRKQIKY
ncbi:MAG: hypothetical protein ABSE91_02515 [Patescibacteria group bacterium]|jgi:hypothetical protein